MTMRAWCRIPFPRVGVFTELIVEALAAHDMRVHREGEAFVATSAFGMARVTPAQAHLDLAIEAATGIDLNRIRHSLTGLIAFNAKSENLRIEWSGDTAGRTLPPDLRILTVRGVTEITPRTRRIHFVGRDLARLAVPDQLHARLLFPPRDVAPPEWPLLDDQGAIVWPGGRQRIGSRVYTIREIDAEAGTLAIDFVLHAAGEGPGLRWVRSARAGDVVGILGPAAHGARFGRRYLLAGDETGLPGIARILASLPADAGGVALIEVEDEGEEQQLVAPAGIDLRWLRRNGLPAGTTSLLEQAVRTVAELGPSTVAWVGCEFQTFRAIRSLLRAAGVPASQQVCFPHWRRGLSEEDIVEIGGEAVAG